MAKYTTSKKDTVASLAEKYGVTRKRLRDLNADTLGHKGDDHRIGRDQAIGKGTSLRLGNGVGQPQWKAQLLEDPTYAAFERQFTFNRGKLGSDFIALKEKRKRDSLRQMAMYDEQEKAGLTNIDESAENRGMFRSGRRHVDRGDLVNRMDDTRQRYTDQGNEAIEAGRRAKREGITALKNSRSEARLDARSRLSDRDAQTKFGF